MNEEDELAVGWVGAVKRAEVRAALEGVYADAGAAIAERGPACWASGRCCNFEKHGHRLYVTGLEAAYCVVGEEERKRERKGGRGEVEDGGVRVALVQVNGVARLGEPGYPEAGHPCPFQVGNLCGVHGIKPLGCRVYFCDRSAQGWQMELSERLLARVRGIHDEFGIEYRYGEWREMLRRFGV